MKLMTCFKVSFASQITNQSSSVAACGDKGAGDRVCVDSHLDIQISVQAIQKPSKKRDKELTKSLPRVPHLKNGTQVSQIILEETICMLEGLLSLGQGKASLQLTHVLIIPVTLYHIPH